MFVNEQANYDVVFNCLGFGAIEFCEDKKLVPIRGQMIRVSNFKIYKKKKDKIEKKIVYFLYIGKSAMD